MTGAEEKQVRSAAGTAASIASLCTLVSEALGADPSLSKAAEAVEGLAGMSRQLSEGLHELAKSQSS